MLRTTRTAASALRRASRRGLATSSPGLELLHESRIPTYHFQDSLPKLPVPKLTDSMRRLLYFAEPLLSKAELEETWRLAADFEYGGEGERLQELLVARDARRYSSFISEPWFDMYLSDRAPLLLNYNPQLTFRDEDASGPGGLGLGPQTQVDRAARLIHASMTFMRTLESGNLEPDVFHTNPARSKTAAWPEVMRLLPRGVSFYGAAATGAYPLDMSQYANLFRSTRLPGAAAHGQTCRPGGAMPGHHEARVSKPPLSPRNSPPSLRCVATTMQARRATRCGPTMARATWWCSAAAPSTSCPCSTATGGRSRCRSCAPGCRRSSTPPPAPPPPPPPLPPPTVPTVPRRLRRPWRPTRRSGC